MELKLKFIIAEYNYYEQNSEIRLYRYMHFQTA